MGTEDRRAYFAHELHDLRQNRQFVEVDDIEIMDIFHDAIEPDNYMAQALCDLQWAPPMRHAVLNEELTDIGLAPEEPQPTGLARQLRTIRDDMTWIIFEQR